MVNRKPAINPSALYFNQRLSQRLALIADYPLTIIEAPMGYGKTSAIRQYMRAGNIEGVWVAISASDPDSFWSDLCARLMECAAIQRRENIDRLARLGYPRDSVLMNQALKLISGLDFSQPTLLVADDCHWLEDPGFTALCEALALAKNHNLHIVLTSRHLYQGSRELLDLKGRLNYIDRSVLSLEAGEIQTYYRLCGINLDDERSGLLFERTRGWISALYLHMLHYAKYGEFGQPGNIQALVEKEVYAPLSPPLKQLLYYLSPLHSFSARQAAYLYRRDNPEQADGHTRQLLRELLDKNSFVLYYPDSQTYTLHNILRDVLQPRFDDLPGRRQRQIYLANGDWFAHQGQTFPAMDFYYRAGDFEKALSALENDMSRSLVTEKARYFVEMFSACPEDIWERHLAANFKYALAAFSSGNFEIVGRRCALLARQCEKFPPGDPQGDAWRGELELLYSLLAYNDIAKMSQHHQKANRLLGRPTRLFGETATWTLGSPSVLFMFHRACGQLENEVRLMFECLPHYYQLAAGHGSGGEYLMQAEALYNAGDFEQAEIVAHKALAFAGRNSQVGNVLCAMFLCLRLALLKGGLQPALEVLRRMEELVQENRDYFLLHTVDLCAGWLYGCLGQQERMPAWLRFQKIGEQPRLYTFAGGFYYLVHGRALLLAGEYLQTLGLFGWLLESKVFAQHQLFMIYAHIYQAIAHLLLEQPERACASLQQALNLALPDRIYMPFAENHDLLQALYCQLAPARPKELEPLLALCAQWHKSVGKIARRGFTRQQLTRRERQMADLATQGKKYAEIARRLNLAPSTVKKAFSVIYRKLGIHSREQLRGYLEKQDV